MRTVFLLLAIDAASAFAPATVPRGLTPLSTSCKSTNHRACSGALHMQTQEEARAALYEEYQKSKAALDDLSAAPPTPNSMPGPDVTPAALSMMEVELARNEQLKQTLARLQATPAQVTDSDDNYERKPWWQQLGDSAYSEEQRKDRRTIFMHDDWVRHRSSERFLRNMLSIGSSGINQALTKEIAFMTSTAAFVVLWNMLFHEYQDFGGVSHAGILHFISTQKLALPAGPFSIAMPALSLLLVFRTNTGYFRWNEARTLWGGLINNCRNVVRQGNLYFPSTPEGESLKRRLAAETQAFVRALRNFLRGPSDDDVLREELYGLVDAGLMSRTQADATMSAANRPMYCLNAMSATLRKADIDSISAARIDSSISILVDLTGANERIFKSPIPLVYTRLTSRFLTFFLLLLPLALWGQLGDSWNHWATIPAEFLISFFLFGIEEVGIQIEEPFSVLPLEAFCNGAITACNDEMLGAVNNGVYDAV